MVIMNSIGLLASIVKRWPVDALPALTNDRRLNRVNRRAIDQLLLQFLLLLLMLLLVLAFLQLLRLMQPLLTYGDRPQVGWPYCQVRDSIGMSL